MWKYKQTAIASGIQGYSIEADSIPLSHGEFLSLLRDSEAFQRFYTSMLCESGYRAFRWETPPVTKSRLDRSFEWVLLDCPELKRNPDVHPFAEYMNSATDSAIVDFPSLKKDAHLIVPKSISSGTDYVHLAAFLRSASNDQISALWSRIGECMLGQINDSNPIWLSTAGMGVAWLHIRLDSRPKYYGYGEYRKDNCIYEQ